MKVEVDFEDSHDNPVVQPVVLNKDEVQSPSKKRKATLTRLNSSTLFNKEFIEDRQRHFLIIYPDNSYKEAWDLFITLVLLLSCIMTPINIAYAKNPTTLTESILNTTIDCLFLCDIIVNFSAAYYTEDMELVDDRKEIAKTYLSGWFTIDCLAILPFDLILGTGSGTDYN